MINQPTTSTVLRPTEAAKRLGLSVVTLQRLRSRHEGPPHLRLTERAVGYRVEDLDAWLETRVAAAAQRSR